jgi:hypothetical protein
MANCVCRATHPANHHFLLRQHVVCPYDEQAAFMLSEKHLQMSANEEHTLGRKLRPSSQRLSNGLEPSQGLLRNTFAAQPSAALEGLVLNLPLCDLTGHVKFSVQKLEVAVWKYSSQSRAPHRAASIQSFGKYYV